MSDAPPPKCPPLKDGFAWYEKLLVRLALAGLVGIAGIGIGRESPAAAVAYLAFALLGGLLLIYDFLCVYCPYPYEHADCLFFPHQLLTALVKRRSGRIPWLRKILFLLTAAGLVLIPQYWLWGHGTLLGVFWILAAAIGLAFLLHYCRRCRHGHCPLNQAEPTGLAEPGHEAD